MSSKAPLPSAITFKALVRLNLRMIGVALLGFYGLGCWHWADTFGAVLYLFALLAWLCALGGFIVGVLRIRSLIAKDRKLKAFAKLGASPKADPRVDLEALRQAGLLR